MKFSRAFTLIELIFVIVVLGILAAVALPRFTGMREQADIAKGRADVATIRTGIVNERQRRVILGDPTWITPANLDNGGLFRGVLTTPMTNSNSASNWYNNSLGDGSYQYYVGSTPTAFTYEDTNGTFTCTAGSGNCNALVD